MSTVIGKMRFGVSGFKEGEAVYLRESYVDFKTKKKHHIIVPLLREQAPTEVPADAVRIIRVNGHAYR